MRLAVAMAVAAFAGCGGDGDTTTSSPSDRSTKDGEPIPTGGLSPATQRELNRLNRRLKAPDTPAERVQGTVTLVLATTTTPTFCKPPFVTGRYLEAAYGGRQGCIDARRIAHKLEFKDLRVDSDRATAVVVPSDGTYKGEQLIVSLVRRDRRWAVDQLDANVPVGP